MQHTVYGQFSAFKFQCSFVLQGGGGLVSLLFENFAKNIDDVFSLVLLQMLSLQKILDIT